MAKRFYMECNCYYNNKGFKVGTKWLWVYNIYSEKTLFKIPLSRGVIEELEEIKEETSSYDARRTYRVINLAIRYDDLLNGLNYEEEW